MKKQMTESEKWLDAAHTDLHRAGWSYLGCDYWRDPVTAEKFSTSSAHRVVNQRAKRKQPRLLLCSDWEGIRKELQRQLKPHGLTVKTKGNYKKWGDQLMWTVEQLADPEYEKHANYCDKHGIDPHNCFS